MSISTVIMFLSTAVSVALVLVYFFISTANQPFLDVADAYYIYNSSSNSGTFVLTLRNIGAVDVTVTWVKLVCSSWSSSSPYPVNYTIPKGTSRSIKINVGRASVYDNDPCVAQLGLLAPSPMSMAIGFRVFSPLYTSTTSNTSGAGNTSVVKLEVGGQPALYGNSTTAHIYVAFKNTGTSPVNLANSIIIIQDNYNRPVPFNFVSGPSALNPGASDNFVYATWNTNINNMPNVAPLHCRPQMATSSASQWSSK